MIDDRKRGAVSSLLDSTLPRRKALKLLAATSATTSPLAATVTSALAQGTSSSDAEGDVVRGGTLTVALDSDIIGVDPHGASAGVDRNVYTTVYNGLVVPDENLEIQPDLAESWDVSEDGTVYTFRLREGIKFHDGTDCDAEAVKWNFDWILDEANASARRSEIATIDEVAVEDPLTVKITLSAPFAPFLSIISDRAGYIVSPTARQKFGEDYTRNPVGTGPFKFVEWVADDHITFERFEDYWEEGLPYLDEIRYRPIPDASVALTELRTENVDFLFSVDPKDIESIKATDNLTYLEGPGVGYQGLWMNTATGPLAEQALREAVSLAIDREALMLAAYFNVGQIANGPIPPSSWAYDPDYPVVKRDLDAARAKLAEGGQPDGFSMVIKAANTPEQQKITQLMQAALAEVGIQAEIQTLEFGALLDAGAEGDFDALSLGWSGRIDPDGNIQPIFGTGGTFNYGKYENPQVNELIEQGRVEQDRAKRAEIYQEIQDIINADVAYVFTYFPPASFAAANHVKGFTVTPDALMRFKKTWLDR
jgi:peptide/nickel transport system substrate-binding protein